tara:strand:- start:24 stop:209 length:186 start_codon:yes stop_codon:yes gene_type:complete
VRLVRKDWIQELYYREFKKPKLKADEFYWEDGKMVMTETYHKRRGYCCNNGCKHCAYKQEK